VKLPRHQSVEGIEDRREENRQAGRPEVVDDEEIVPSGHRLERAHRIEDAAESEEEIEDRKRRRNHVDAAAKVLLQIALRHHSISAMTVSATFTLSFSATLMFVCAGKNMSTREPNLIMPTRSPRTASS